MAKAKKKKAVRLSKAVRELKVASSTLVEFIQAKGVEIDEKDLNAKIPPEVYELVLEEFADEKAKAERHEKRVQAFKSRHDEDTSGEVVSLESDLDPAEQAVPVAQEASSAEAPAEEAAPEPEAEVPVAPPAEAVAESTVEDAVVAPDVVEAEAPVEQQAPATDVPDAEPEPETVSTEATTPVEVEAVPAEQDAPPSSAAAPADEPVADEPVAEVDVPKDVAAEATAEAPPQAAPPSEGVDPAAEAEEAAPADSETADTAEADAVAEAPPQGGDGEAAAEDESTISATRYTLSGPKVLGKVDLSKVEDSDGARRKRKRKRKAAAAETPSSGTSTARPDRTDKKKKTGGKKKKGGPKVDQEDVQATLQQTLREMEQGASRARQRRRRQRRDERAEQREQAMVDQLEQDKVLRITEFVSTGELADLLAVAVTDVISTLFELGIMATINQRLDADTISLVAEEYNYEVDFIQDVAHEEVDLGEDDPEDLKPRSPVVTVMGHVDHGKTSLLDYIRRESVVSGEAGGITQHIGAYEVRLPDGRPITFLDTPGHEAFTAMRARGAQVTDVVILVVAADDAVMPQTIEAINHAKAGGVPIVVAINKIDRPEANPDKIYAQLADQSVLVEQYGGQVQAELVSAKTGQGIDDLLERVLVEAEVLELQANPDRNAYGTVIESRLDKGRGVVSTVLVEAGTLRVGDAFVAGVYAGRVRAMFNELDQRIEEAGPSKPVLVLGFNGQPDVGDRLIVFGEESEARDVAAHRQQIQREQMMHQRKHITLDDIGRRLALGELVELNLIVKGDVGGSVEALSDSLLKIQNDEVKVNIIHSGVGAITESDVSLASASDAVIIGFQVRPNPGVRTIAEQEEIDIRLYSVIYDAIEDVRDALEGMLSPEKSEQTRGTAEVREIFKVPKIGTIAGSAVVEGKMRRNDLVRLIRDGVVVYQGRLSSLRRFKEDAKEVATGFECGIGIENFNDIKVGDHIEAYEIIETKRQLTV